MRKYALSHLFPVLFSCLVLILPNLLYAQLTLDCSLSQCHETEYDQWLLSRHSDTQNDVAGELAEEWAGLPADSVILGQNAEDCIACHGATSVTANGGMTEVQAMEYFFSSTDGIYTDSTMALHTDEWPHNACVACHDVPDDHPASMPTLALFNSPSAQYVAIGNVSTLCGQCHGTLRYPDTDHRRQDAWQMSRHGHGGQDDVAGELAEEWAGSSPEEVVGEEDCIACHAPTAVLLNGGISEADAVNLLFSTESGVFSENTAPQNTDQWPEVSCNSCHNQHNPGEISYFNSGTKEYEVLSSPQELCGKCHGNIRFPDTDHLSYNIAQGTGGIGVDDLQTMPGIQCIDCHMHISDVEGTNASMFGGHLWSSFYTEEDGTESTSCTPCHPSMDAPAAHSAIMLWQNEFADLDSIANVKVASADSLLAGSSDSTKIQMLQEAQFNLAFAEGDESGGIHNHNYTIALLNDAIEKTTDLLSISDDNFNSVVKGFALYPNYPNPFNPSTNIRFSLQTASKVKLEVFDVAGKKIAVLADNQEYAGFHTITFDASDLASGTYFVRLTAGKYQKTIKMVLLR